MPNPSVEIENYMRELLHTSLPIEYQLKYGTACGNLDWSQFVREATMAQTKKKGHITYGEAFSKVEKERTYTWFDDRRKTICALDKRVLACGNNNRFDQFWKIKPSAGMPVWQYQVPV